MSVPKTYESKRAASSGYSSTYSLTPSSASHPSGTGVPGSVGPKMYPMGTRWLISSSFMVPPSCKSALPASAVAGRSWSNWTHSSHSASGTGAGPRADDPDRPERNTTPGKPGTRTSLLRCKGKRGSSFPRLVRFGPFRKPLLGQAVGAKRYRTGGRRASGDTPRGLQNKPAKMLVLLAFHGLQNRSRKSSLFPCVTPTTSYPSSSYFLARSSNS